MPAVSAIFVLFQALLAVSVYFLSKRHSSRSGLVVAGTVFALGFGLTLVLSSIVDLLVAEIALVLVYLVGLRIGSRSPHSA